MEKETSESIVINEIQLLLAEKRTSLSMLRTGIAVFVLPLSVLGALMATSKYYDIYHVLPTSPSRYLQFVQALLSWAPTWSTGPSPKSATTTGRSWN